MPEPMPPDALPFVTADQIRRSVPIADLIDSVEAAFRAVASGEDRSPLRTHVPLDDGDLLLMPGVRAGGSGFTVKLVTVVGSNAERGLPTVQAVVVWFDAATGRPSALIDGPALTAMRTGAASGVATRLLARPDSSTAAIIGSGAQAEWQLRAVLAVRPIRRVAVYARTAAAREEFAAHMAADTGVEVRAAGSAQEAVSDADVVCCATTSSTPVFDAGWLRPGAHVNGIGSFRPGMVEIPPDAFARAFRVGVDSRTAVLAEAGDLLAAIDAGSVSAADLVEIGSVPGSWSADQRPQDAITVFKSVGLAIQDVAAAELIVGRLFPEAAARG